MLGAALSTALLSGCAAAVDGTALRRQSTGLKQVLPTPAQVNVAVGNRLDPTGPAAVGSIDLLPNGIRDGSQVNPVQCLGPATPLMQAVYEGGDVTGVGLRDFARFGEGLTVSSAHTGVVRFASDAEAARMFAAFVETWRSCDGTAVTVRITPNSALVWKITDVRLDGDVLSATILNAETDSEPAFPTEHAIGLEADCIVDVDVAVTDVLPSRRVATGRAAALVGLMRQNISGAR